MNVDVFWETSVGFLQMCDVATFPEIKPSLCQFERQKVEQNSTAFKK